MNTKGIKFLAVLAVLAMAFAAFAVINTTFDSDATDVSKANVNGTGIGFTVVNAKENATVIYSDGKGSITVSGPVAPIAGTTYSAKTYQHVYAMAKITGLETTKHYKIVQTNTALKDFQAQEPDDIKVSGSTFVKTKEYAPIGDAFYAFLLPIDGSKVTIEITSNDSTAKGTGVYTIDCSKLNTEVSLSADIEGPGFVYTTTGNKLTLNSFDSNIVFYSNTADLVVELKGTNKAYTYGASYTRVASEGQCFINELAGAMTIKSIESNASLTINADGDAIGTVKSNVAWGLNTSGNMIIGDNTASKTVLKVTGNPNRSLRTTSALTIDKADVEVIGTEYAIRTTGNVTVQNGSTVTTNLAEYRSNDWGADEYWGIKADAATIKISSDSKVITQGIVVNTISTKATFVEGQLFVKGDYVQQKAETTLGINGLFVKTINAGVEAQEVSTTSGTDKGIFIVTGAKAYGIIVKNGTDITEEIINDATAAQIQDAAKDATSTVKVITAVINESIANLDVTIDKDKTLTLLTNGATTTIGGTIKFSDDTSNTVKLTGVKGSFSIVKGSIEIDGEIKEGSFELAAGADVKMKGGIDTSDITITSKNNKAATITIEEGNTFTISSNKSLIIGKGITLNVYGTITDAGAGAGEKGLLQIAEGATLNVGDKGAIYLTGQEVISTVTYDGLYGAGKFNALAGSTVAGNFTGTGDFIAYSGSDINDIVATTSWANMKGMDSDGGYWEYTYDAAPANTKLKLNAYNGTYNFKSFKDVPEITISGVNSVTFATPATLTGKFVMFNNVNTIQTVTGTGSLAIELDASATDNDSMKTYGVAIIEVAVNDQDLALDSISLDLTIKGTNATWEATKIKAAGILNYLEEGEGKEDIKVDNSTIVVDVLSAYSGKTNISGITTDSIEANASSITITSGGLGIKSNEKLTLKNTTSLEVTAKNEALNAKDIVVNGTSTLTADSGVKISGAATIKQDSGFNVKGLTLKAGASITNNGTAKLSGTTVIEKTGTITNESDLTIDGTVYSQGTIDNNNGTLTNNAKMVVYGKYSLDLDTVVITLPDATSTTASAAFVKTITINDSNVQKDGSVKIKTATVGFIKNDGTAITPAIGVTGYNAYKGTLTPSQTTANASYVLTISNGTSSISLTYDADTAGGTIGTSYTLAVSGNIVDTTPEPDKTYSLVSQTTGAVTDGVVTGGKITKTSATITVDGGTFANTSELTFYGVDEVAFVAKDAAFAGNITFGIQPIAVAGTIGGNITSAGNLTFGDDSGFMGEIVTDGNVVSTGGIIGNITAKGNVTVDDLIGNITVNADNGGKEVKFTGEAAGTLTYVSKNKATPEAETKTEYTATMGYDTEAKDDGFTITLVGGTDATSSSAVVPGYFKFKEMNELGTGKTVDLKLTAGRLLVSENFEMLDRYALTVEAGTTLEVSSVAAFDVTKAGLKVSKDATSNFVTGSTVPTTYGKVNCVMSFTIDGGAYTIYSNVAYALANCNEGSILTVEAVEAVINDNIVIPKDVNVIVGNGTTLKFGIYGVTMSEGAKISLSGTGKVTFDATGSKDYNFYEINGTFVFDKNAIAFDEVRFCDVSTLVGVAATSTAPAKLSATLFYNEGEATITSGNVTGAITLGNTAYAVSEGAADTLFSGKLTISDGTVCEATIADKAYVGTKPTKESPVVDTALATVVTVNGTLKVADSMTIKGNFYGTGTIVLSPNKSITIDTGKYFNAVEENYYGPVFNGTIVDTSDAANGYAMALVMAEPKTAAEAGGKALVISSVKTSAEEYMKLSGTVYFGGISATTTAKLDGLTIGSDASVIADVTDVINNDATAKGDLKTIELNVKSTDKPSLKSLIYDTKYEQGEYTVYTELVNIDFEEVSDITIVKDYELKSENLDGAKKVDLTGLDINITIEDGYALKLVDVSLIIGTPRTTVGGEGSSIVGKVIIYDDQYIVAYADVDLLFAEFEGYKSTAAAKADVVSSRLDVEESLYATVFAADVAGKTPELAKVDRAIVPEIVGFNFTAWVNYNGNVAALVGDTNAYADAKAVLCTVMVKYVAGVDYYMDGVLFSVYDIPTDVPYGSYFTAKISDTTKYQGNPLINGQKTVVVDDDMELVASGVTPIPEPEPEPVIGDSGLSLTDILLIVLVVLIAIMVVILVLRLNRS